MFYFFAEMLEFEGLFNLIRYQTFRAGAATVRVSPTSSSSRPSKGANHPRRD